MSIMPAATASSVFTQDFIVKLKKCIIKVKIKVDCKSKSVMREAATLHNVYWARFTMWTL